MGEFTNNGFTLTLRALRELDYHDTIKVISSRTGRVLIHNYNANKQGYLGDLNITGIFTEIAVGRDKDWAKPILVAWAYEDQYKELKEKAKEAVKDA